MTTFKELKMHLKNNSKKIKKITIDDIPIEEADSDLSKKNHILTIGIFDNKDGSLHGQFYVTPAYFDNDMKKLNRVISNTTKYLKEQLVKENIVFIGTIH